MKLNYFLTLFFVLKASFLFAQIPYLWEVKYFDKIQNFEILLDKDYTFEQILTDSTLEFQENPKSYKFEKEEYCWFRFLAQNPSVYTKEGYIELMPNIDNTMYYYDFENNKWDSLSVGFAVLDFKRKMGVFPIVLQAKQINTFYFKLKVKDLHSQHYPINLFAVGFSKKDFENNEQFVFVSWLVVCFAVSLFIIYNLYIYISLKDKTYLYYIIMILGGLLYVTFFARIFNFILPFSFYNLDMQPNGTWRAYTLDNILSIFFIWLLLFGYVQFSRTYLQLSSNLVFWDRILKYMLILFSVFSLFFLVTSCFKSFYIYGWLAFISNLLVVVIILLICYATILSYRKGEELGFYSLLANLFPLLIVCIIAISLLINDDITQPIRLLPHIALVSKTVTFAIALVARINLLKDELKEKQLQAEILEKENEKMLARNRYIELENEHIIADMVTAINREMDLQEKIKLEANQKAELQQKIELEAKQKTDLQAKLEANQRELTANTLYLYQKNELLTNLQKQIQNLSYQDTTTQNREGIREIKSALKNDIQLDSDWDNFKLHFEQVHPNFFKELNEKYPTLTKNEIRLAAYYHLNMSVKEIATLLNIHPRSVHKAKSRLNKKMEVMNNEN